MEMVEQQTRKAPVDRPAIRLLPSQTEGIARGTRAGIPVLPLGPGSRFGRLHWGGHCVNCGEHVPPGERGWIDPSDTEVLCIRCWPPLVIG